MDAKARIVTERVSKILGQPLIIVNKPGAGMRIGTEQLLRSPADGYTVQVAVQAVAWMGPMLDPAVTYKPLTDMTMLALGYENPMVLVVSQQSGIKSVADLLRVVRSQPGKLNWAGPAGASGYRVWYEVFKSVAGLDFTRPGLMEGQQHLQPVRAARAWSIINTWRISLMRKQLDNHGIRSQRGAAWA